MTSIIEHSMPITDDDAVVSLIDQFAKVKVSFEDIDELPYEKWLDMQEDRLRDPDIIAQFVDTDFWRDVTAKYRRLLVVGERFVNWRHPFHSIVLRDDIVQEYQRLVNEPPQGAVPGVGPISASKLSACGIQSVSQLIVSYRRALKDNLGFSGYCLYLRKEVGLDRTVYFRVALFTHIVSRFSTSNTAVCRKQKAE